MKIAVVGAGAIGGYLGARLSLAGEEVTFIARGPNLAAIQANGLKLIAEDGTESRTTAARAVQKMSDAGAARRGAADGQGAPGRRSRAGAAASVSCRDRDRHDAERNPLVVLPQARRRVRREAGAKRRSGRHHRPQHRSGAVHRQRRLSGREPDRSRRGASRGRQPVHAGRAGRLDHAARAGH